MGPPASDQAPAPDAVLISRDALGALIATLADDGYQVLGPTVRDEAIVYDRITSVDDLPAGWTDRQGPGRYRLERREDGALFGFTVGPQSWKRFLHPPVEPLWFMHDDGVSLTVRMPDAAAEKFAFIGVRACELHAIAIQDRVFCDGPYPDVAYRMRRRGAFIVAVNCAQAADTCFCASMRTGPKAESGFDLALTELVEGSEQAFLVEIGSEAGAAMIARIGSRPAAASDRDAADAIVERTAGQMGRQLDTDGLKECLQNNLNHSRWDAVAQRCLSCGNCTMVCPTCFCTTVEDHSALAGGEAARVRKWDSCFTMDFSYIHGGSVRKTAASRYRQWLTHKLANWIDQFGTSGCVGCGRCITWCPVGIDLTEEVAAIRGGSHAAKGDQDGRA